MGETDAQRLGFAKTPKISAPLIYTQKNFRIDHNEKTVIACGGYEWDNQFKFDSHRLKRNKPYAVNVGYDRKQDTTYLTGSKIRVKESSTDAPTTYMTTVGLYSADNELMAVAKLSEPLKKDPSNELTLRVRLDY